MYILLLSVIACIMMTVFCYLGTGTDKKNLSGLRSYPDNLQEMVRQSTKYKDQIKDLKPLQVFVSNLILFSIILFVLGLFIKTPNFIVNFEKILVIGQIINLYDLLVLDMIWFKNSPRVRFSEFPDKELYKDSSNHIKSFLKGIFMFFLVAIIDGIILTLI